MLQEVVVDRLDELLGGGEATRGDVDICWVVVKKDLLTLLTIKCGGLAAPNSLCMILCIGFGVVVVEHLGGPKKKRQK